MIELKTDKDGTMIKLSAESKQMLFKDCVRSVRAVYKAIAQDNKEWADKMYSMLVAFMIAERETITAEIEGEILIRYDIKEDSK